MPVIDNKAYIDYKLFYGPRLHEYFPYEPYKPYNRYEQEYKTDSEGTITTEEDMKTVNRVTYKLTRAELAELLGVEDGDTFISVNWDGSGSFSGLVVIVDKLPVTTELVKTA